MHVIATAGHVDHGKSTLVRSLTGTDPDRLAEEHRRGLSIELGYAWTHLAPVGDIAFVDVPGHERFVSTMLSGVGPVPAVLFVVAADDPWMPQAAEHLAAIDGLGVSRGLLAVTRADLADPVPAMTQALAEIRRTSLGDVPAVAVSARTGLGLDELRHQIGDLASGLAAPDPHADVRLWVDRSFHVRGAGTVVTGTLPAGTIAIGDTLTLDDVSVRVRGIQCLGRSVTSATGVSRVALNLVGVGGKLAAGPRRGSFLVSTGQWRLAPVADARLVRPGRLPERPLLHVGATSVGVRVRPFDESTIRLVLERPLPLRVGDRALVRDPGSREVWGLNVLDPDPPPLRRRGAAALRAKELAFVDGSLFDEVRRRGIVRRSLLRRLGIDTVDVPVGVEAFGDWLLSEDRVEELQAQMGQIVRDRSTQLEPGVPVAAVARALNLPTPDLVGALARPPLEVRQGKVLGGRAGGLPQRLLEALDALREDAGDNPFAAPGADRLRELGLDQRSLGALARAGHLLRLDDTVVLLGGSDVHAAGVLRQLRQPFTTSEARVAMATSRRVALALLAHLDRRGMTKRLPDDRRRVAEPPR